MEKKISSVTVTQLDYIIRDLNDEELDLQGHPHLHSEYDPAGNLLKEIRYNRHGDFEEMFEYAYNTDGRMTRESYYPVENELAEEKLFELDGTGRVLRSVKHYQDGSVDTTTYHYDDAGQLLKKTTINDDGETDQVETFEWDHGTLVGHGIVDGEGEELFDAVESLSPAYETRMTHNEKNQVVSEEELDENGDVYMTVNRTYDEDGRSDEVEVFVDGRGKAISRHYILKYSYTFFE